MHFKNPRICLFTAFAFWAIFSSCVNTQKVAYFNDVKDSARIMSKASLEPVIQKKDILSITVSSLSNEATVIFNTPNLPITPSGATSPNMPQTAGYLVGDDGTIKFPVLGNIPAAGLTQKQLENNITKQLIDKKLLFDPNCQLAVFEFPCYGFGRGESPRCNNRPKRTDQYT